MNHIMVVEQTKCAKQIDIHPQDMYFLISSDGTTKLPNLTLQAIHHINIKRKNVSK